MKRKYGIQFFVLMGLTLYSCGAFRQMNKSKEALMQDSLLKIEKQSKTETANREQMIQMEKDSDSAAGSFHLLIWPKGRFSLSEGKGFEGEADSVKLNGDFRKSTRHKALRSTSAAQQTSLAATASQQLQTKSRQVEKAVQRKPAYALGIIVLIILAVTVFLLYKRKDFTSKCGFD